MASRRGPSTVPLPNFSRGEFEDSLYYEAGRLYGIPACCVRSYVQGRKDQRPRSTAGSYPDEFRNLYYTPCSESCAESKELGRSIRVMLEGLDPEAAPKRRADPSVEKIFA